MLKPTVVLAAAALLLNVAAATAGSPAPGATASPPMTLVAAKKSGVIPANCTIDPWKKVYVCCNGPDNCTEHPLDTKWPVVRQLHLQQVKPQQTQPLTVDPGVQ